MVGSASPRATRLTTRSFTHRKKPRACLAVLLSFRFITARTVSKKPVKSNQKPAVGKPKPQDPDKKARVHEELAGFEIGVNPLGEITSNYTIEQINQFLGRHVRDKKLADRAGQFGEKPAPDEEELFLVEDGAVAEPEESDEEFMKRSSREAKRKKDADPAE